MQYSARVVERVINPTNAGSMDENDPEVGVGLVGAPSCGDVLMLYLRIREGKIIDARFKTFGCGSAIAASQLATEKLLGTDASAPFDNLNQELFEYLGLPPVKWHCSVLAKEAVDAAIDNYMQKSRPANSICAA